MVRLWDVSEEGDSSGLKFLWSVILRIWVRRCPALYECCVRLRGIEETVLGFGGEGDERGSGDGYLGGKRSFYLL